jgi:NAD(P)-dependent dehydrogenase (short-subunit alcohol dehydrogenase family)
VTGADAAAARSAARTRHSGTHSDQLRRHRSGAAHRRRDGPLPLDDFARVINVSLIGTLQCDAARGHDMHSLDPLEDGERGVIVSTASVAAYDGQIGQAAYAASKGAVASLMLPAAREFAQFGIRVMAIAPGIFATPMVSGMPPEVQASLAAAIPFPKVLGRPEQFADLALHIIENRYLNGEMRRLDGAIRLAPR